MTIAGSATSSRLNCSSSPRPLMPGIRTSINRQPGREAIERVEEHLGRLVGLGLQTHGPHEHRERLPHGRIVVDDENGRIIVHGYALHCQSAR